MRSPSASPPSTPVVSRTAGSASPPRARAEDLLARPPSNWACAAAQRFHHKRLLDAGVRILDYPTMLHAKAFVRDGEELLLGTCNLDAWSLKRSSELDLQLWSEEPAAQFDERFSAPAEEISKPGRAVSGLKERVLSTAIATISSLL